MLLALPADEQMMTLRREAGLIVEDYEIQFYGGGDDQSLQTLLRGLTAAMSNLGYL